MRRDLALHSRDPAARAGVRAWLIGRAQWSELGGEFSFTHADAGVHFELEVAADPGPGEPLARLLLPAERPWFFMCGALCEIAPLAAACGLADLPQASASFDPQRFVARWWQRHRDFSERSADPESRLSGPCLDRVWRWNLERAALAHELLARGSRAHVPRVSFVGHAGRALTAIEWADAGAIVLPEVDVVLACESLSVRVPFVTPVKRAIGWEQLPALPEAAERLDRTLGARRFEWDEAPLAVRRALAAGPVLDGRVVHRLPGTLCEDRVFAAAVEAPGIP